MADSKIALADLKDQLDVLRPVCPRWGSKKGCRHSQTCKFRHPERDGHDPRQFSKHDLPHACRHTDAQGVDYIVARPPLAQAWDKYWQSKGIAFFVMATIFYKVLARQWIGIPSA